MMKDEAPFLLEWFAHHLAVGFTKILVYTNDCSDGTDDMLIRLEELGLGYHRRNIIPKGAKPQPSAIQQAQTDPIVRQANWVLLFDADEFLCINYGDGTLDPMLTAAGDANGIVITWRIFGSGNIIDWSRTPVSEQYLYAAPPTWNKGWGVKTLFKFDHEYWRLGIHRPSIKKRHLETGFPDTVKWLNGSGLPMEDYFKFRGWRSIRRTVGYQWAQMNHYAVKSVDSYVLRRLRGNVNNKKDKYNSEYWALQDRNEVRDDKILRYKSRREAIMDELLTDPVLAKLHFAALERAEAQLETYRKTDAYEELKAALIEAGKTPITQVQAKPPKARDAEKARASMSQAERKNAERPAEERRTKPSPEFRDTTEGGDGFVVGEIDISVEVAIDWVPNHGIDLPADMRVFSPTALEAVLRGRYLRRQLRLARGIMQDGDRVLDLGAGIGFLSIYTCNLYPNSTVVAQEENASRGPVTEAILKQNNLNLEERFTLSNTPLLFQDDPAKTVSAIQALVAKIKPDVVRISYEALAGALLARISFGDVRRVALIGNAAKGYHEQFQDAMRNGLKLNDKLSLPEIIIFDRQDPVAGPD